MITFSGILVPRFSLLRRRLLASATTWTKILFRCDIQQFQKNRWSTSRGWRKSSFFPDFILSKMSLKKNYFLNCFQLLWLRSSSLMIRNMLELRDRKAKVGMEPLGLNNGTSGTGDQVRGGGNYRDKDGLLPPMLPIWKSQSAKLCPSQLFEIINE